MSIRHLLAASINSEKSALQETVSIRSAGGCLSLCFGMKQKGLDFSFSEISLADPPYLVWFMFGYK